MDSVLYGIAEQFLVKLDTQIENTICSECKKPVLTTLKHAYIYNFRYHKSCFFKMLEPDLNSKSDAQRRTAKRVQYDIL